MIIIDLETYFIDRIEETNDSELRNVFRALHNFIVTKSFNIYDLSSEHPHKKLTGTYSDIIIDYVYNQDYVEIENAHSVIINKILNILRILEGVE